MARHEPRRSGPGELRARAIGRAIATGRRMRRLRQSDLATECGVSLNAVQAWEQGASLISLRLLFEVSRVLDVTPSRLLQAAEKYESILTTWTGKTTAPGRKRAPITQTALAPSVYG